MRRRKTRLFVTAFIFMIISLTTLNYVYAKNNVIMNKWNVTITNGAKDINDTHMIKFEVKRNNDVVLGKIAPGMKATAEIDIDLQKINGFVDIEIEFDNSKLNDIFSLNVKFDDEYLSSKNKKKVKAGKIQKVLLELIWDGNDLEDTELGINTDSIEIPIKIKVLQH
ncbi:MAG TPA: hypothetical protein DEP51_04755, partial [Clostridiales bacterium]|nr:hypothetical protein [Clostridiales bacterium]